MMRDEEVRETLSRLNDLLARLEETPGPVGELARDAFSALTEVYGEALARALRHVASVPTACEGFLSDELLGHLLVLHDIHPEPAADRVRRIIDELSPAIVKRGGEIEFAGINDGVATIRLSSHGCGSSTAGLDDVVREEVLALAPELSGVEVISGVAKEPAFIPLESLLPRPAAGVRT